ncbi:AIPR family protein [Bacillus sp. NP157]|nr:AIPR family protein [Bacillus sp. NP157]
MEETEFFDELRQMVMLRAESDGLVDSLAFVAEIGERLSEDPVFGELKAADYSGRDSKGREFKIHGFTEFDDSDGTLSIAIARWHADDSPATLMTPEVVELQALIHGFVAASLNERLSEKVVESSPAYELSSTIDQRRDEISCIRYHLFSNRSLAKRYKRESRSEIRGIPVELHIWDLERIRALYASAREREVVEISLADFGSEGIPCILASSAEGLTSYLCVIGGDLLADLFERYGSRLLEGNVRSFLGMKGGVNRGIRSTIQHNAPLFFAFNNGIAATAASAVISTNNGLPVVVGLSDLQIVNGGQTTANVLRARKQDRLPLAGVSVPMKLTVVESSQANDLIPQIAEFANTQNKIAVADFFANHPFHRKMEEISRRLLVPAQGAARVQSKWFYERARGQYQNERMYLSKARKASHDLEFPPKQVINKTDLAKLDSVLSKRPHWVSLGAQKNFVKFAGQFSSKGVNKDADSWADLSPAYGDDYYKRIVAMSVLWNRGEGIVAAGKATWYRGDYRPQIVAYAWALVFLSIERAGREVSLLDAWDRQAIDSDLENAFLRAAVLVQDAILDLPVGSSNVGEWTKREACWLKVSEKNLSVPKILERWSRSREERRQQKVEERKRGIQDDGISAQAQVVAYAKSGYWAALAEWPRLAEGVFGPELELLSRAVTPQSVLRIQSQRDWVRLLEISRRCEADGFRFLEAV